MNLESFINELNSIDECRIRYLTKVYLVSDTYKIILKLLYVEDIKIIEDYLNIKLTDGRILNLKIDDNLRFWREESLI